MWRQQACRPHCNQLGTAIASIGIPARMAVVLRIAIAAAARPSSASLLRSLPAFLACSRKAALRPPIGRGLHSGAVVMSSSTDFKVRTSRRGPAMAAGGGGCVACKCMAHRSHPQSDSQEYLFGPWKIAAEEVFVTSPHSFAFVNLKPVRHTHTVLAPLPLPLPLPSGSPPCLHAAEVRQHTEPARRWCRDTCWSAPSASWHALRSCRPRRWPTSGALAMQRVQCSAERALLVSCRPRPPQCV